MEEPKDAIDRGLYSILLYVDNVINKISKICEGVE